MKFAASALSACFALSLLAAPAHARQWEVKMLNKGSNGKLMVFEPAFIAAKPGDTVKFLATDKGHNAETIAGMAPKGAAPFKGKINQEVVLKLSAPGLYGYKCLPHAGMGMVGLIQVGPAANKAEAAAAAARLPGLAKKEMGLLIAKAR